MTLQTTLLLFIYTGAILIPYVILKLFRTWYGKISKQINYDFMN